MSDLAHTSLESLEVGAVPVINDFLERLQLRQILDRHLPPPPRTGRTHAVSPADTVLVLIRNILLSREPMYAIPQWLNGFVPELFGLTPDQAYMFNDDRIGRTLDAVFACRHAVLLTDIVLQTIRVFEIDLSQFHQDTTSVTFHGAYADSKPDGPAPHITFGFNKDHRPDLKQLLWSLVVSADGAVPVHFRLHPGNTADSDVHQQTWDTLRQLAGTTNFCYVADCKLASSENMRYIDDHKGTFLTVLPRTRKECDDFATYADEHPITWREVRRDVNTRDANGPDSVYHGWESPQRSREGFRILWYRSSQKLHLDQEQRGQRLAAARLRLKELERRAKRNTSVRDLQEASERILKENKVEGLLTVTIQCHVQEEFKQQGRGRPGPDTRYERVEVTSYVVTVADNGPALAAEARWDGLFPLITNSPTFTLEETLDKYKYQPFLEKRHQQLKSVLEVAPVYLNKPERVASLLLLYFITLLVYALIEREVRRRMTKEDGLQGLPLYPEMRSSKRPTADLALAAFLGLRRHRLLDATGSLLKTFHDPLSPGAEAVLRLLRVDPQPYREQEKLLSEEEYNS